MAGKLSPRAQMKMAELRRITDKVHHVHGLVEKYAATKNPQHARRQTLPIKRAFGKLKLELMGAGFDTLSQLAGSMELAAGRGGSQRNKVRILREGVGSMRFQMDQEQRKLAAEDQRAQREEARQAKEDAGEAGPTPPAQDES
ncbi:MAG: hypothetical protein R3314_07090 [Longimicrobiales bacterium]|nr:hypothetical protein [Longimicrobiales bacterium]